MNQGSEGSKHAKNLEEKGLINRQNIKSIISAIFSINFYFQSGSTEDFNTELLTQLIDFMQDNTSVNKYLNKINMLIK